MTAAVLGLHMRLSREVLTRTPPCPAAAVAARLVVQRGSPADVDLHGCCAVHWNPLVLSIHEHTHTYKMFSRQQQVSEEGTVRVESSSTAMLHSIKLTFAHQSLVWTSGVVCF